MNQDFTCCQWITLLLLKNVRRHSSKADCVDNLFDKDELDWLWKNASYSRL